MFGRSTGNSFALKFCDDVGRSGRRPFGQPKDSALSPLVRLALSLPVLVAAAGGPALAQGLPPQLPGPAEPDIPDRRLPPAVEPQRPVPGVAPEIEPARPPAGAEAVSFVLRDIEIDGATAYPVEAFRPYFEAAVGEEITLADFYEIAAAIEARYRSDG
jgi:hemolysin activation/secretion protein